MESVNGEIVSETETAAVNATVSEESGGINYASAAFNVCMGIIAMVLIYIIAEKSRSIAAFVDRLFGRVIKPSDGNGDVPENNDAEPSPARVEDSNGVISPENYKVYDIYEGELNLDDSLDENKKDGNENG
ncbi:MAG: hypothetical protein ACI4JJ_01255 [Huintestinicola sp.]